MQAMTYPSYVIPPATGVTWAAGPFPLQPLDGRYLCTEAQAQAILDAYIGSGFTDAKLVNAATTDIGYKFGGTGIDPASQYQPWWIVGTGIPPLSPAGFAVWYMNREGVGKPGRWVNVGRAGADFVFDVVVAPPPPPPTASVDNSGSLAQLLGVGQAFSQADRDELNDIRRLVVALAAKSQIS